MKIKEIHIKNYCGIAERTIYPEKITMLLGECGTGKSSTLAAIRYAFTGKSDQKDIKNGQAKASVSIVFDDGTSIQRIRDANGTTVKCNGKRASAKATTEFVNEKFGTNTKAFEALCGTDFFESLSKKEMTEFFLSILPVKINFQSICQMASEKMGQPLSKSQVGLLMQEFLGRELTEKETEKLPGEYPKDDKIFDLEDIDKAYRSLFEARKLQKNTVKILEARAGFSGDLPKEKKEDLEQRLYAIAQKTAEVSTYQKNLASFQRIMAQRKMAEEKKRQIGEALKAYADAARPDQKEKDQAEEDKKKFQHAIQKCRSMIGALEANVAIFEKTLQSLDRPVCPISKKLICTTDKTPLKKELLEIVGMNRGKIVENQVFIKRCEEQINKRDKILKDFETKNLRYMQRISLEKQAAAIVIPDLPEKPKEIQTSTMALEEERKKIQEKLSVWAAYEATKKVEKDLAAAKSVLKDLDACVEILDAKSGIRITIIQKVLEPFERLLNEKAKKIRDDFQIKFMCEDGIVILASPRKDAGFLSLQQLSTGEFVYVAYLLMSVVNELTNGRILIIDSIDKLDKKYLSSLVNFLEKDPGFDNIFIGGVNHDDTVNTTKDKTLQIIM